MVRSSPLLPTSRSRPLASLADVLEPIEGDDDLPTRVGPVRAPEADMAFADTVVANDLDEVAPVSAPFVLKDPAATKETPLAFPVESARPDEGFFASLRRNVRGAASEIADVWNDAGRVRSFTAPVTIFGLETPELVRAPLARVAYVLARLRAVLSAWDWGLVDVVRACAIGAVVFALAAFAGVFALSSGVLQLGPEDTASAAPELREPRTVESEHATFAKNVRRKASAR